MEFITPFLQVVVALGLLNVWLIRRDQKTPYRGGSSVSLKNEFIAYGLPLWFFYFVGFIKISSALFLLLGLWEPLFIFPAAFVVSCLMVGAIGMHLKVGDPWKKFLPALTMLFFSICLCIRSF